MKYEKLLISLLVSAVALTGIAAPAGAEYTGPNSSARRYSTTVPGTCTEEYSCCTWWSEESCGSNEWDIGCCLSYGTCTREVECTETVTASHPDATISVSASCLTGFGSENWCAGDITLTLKGKDDWKGITGFESSAGHRITAGGKKTESATLTFSGDQMEMIEFWALSGLGDTSKKASYSVKIDQKYPVNDIIISGNKSGDWYYGPVTILSAARDSFLDKQWVDAGFGESANSYTIPSDFSGTVTPKSRSVDQAGNSTGWTTFDPISIDNEKPLVLEETDPEGRWFNEPLSLSVSGTDEHSGVRTGLIFVDGELLDASGNPAAAAYSGIQGMHEVTYQVEDFASNRSEVSGPYSFGFDTEPPVIRLDSNQSLDVVGPVVTLSGTVTDNASGVQRVQIRRDADGAWEDVTGKGAAGSLSSEWSHELPQDIAEGDNSFFVRAEDAAGNVSQAFAFTLRTDKTAPETVNLRIEGEKGPGEVYRGAVSFIGEAEDSVAGVKSVYVDLGLGGGEKPDRDAVPAGFSGVVSACVRAVDNVGNSTDCIPQAPVMVDNGSPYPVEYTQPDSGAVYGTSAVFRVKGADDLSSMYTVTIVSDGIQYPAQGDAGEIRLGELGNGPHEIFFNLTDNAGNIYSSADDPAVGKFSVHVDSTPPSVSLIRPEDGAYVSGTVTVSGAASDNLGLEGMEILLDGKTAAEEPLTGTEAPFSRDIDTSALPEGAHTVTVIASDAAGNVSDPVTAGIIVDHTAPDCRIEVYGTMGDGGSFRGEVRLSAVCTDEGSGVAEKWIDTGDGRNTDGTVVPEDYSGAVVPSVGAVDHAGNDSGAEAGDMILMPDGTSVEKILVDNNPPRVTDYFAPDNAWLSVESIRLYVRGEDTEGPLYSGTVILNGEPFEIPAEDDSAELTADMPEGISKLRYFVTDLAGNRSEIIGE